LPKEGKTRIVPLSRGLVVIAKAAHRGASAEALRTAVAR